MQQLDLFANYTEEPQTKSPQKKAVDALVAEVQRVQVKEVSETKEREPFAKEQALIETVSVAEPVQESQNKRGRKSFKDMDADIVMVEVPEDEVLFQKQYYSISEVARWFHVNQSLLRYWENEFSVLKPRKTRKGDRLFRPEDVKSLQLIYYLLRQRKFSIEGARQYLKDNKKKADVQMQLIQSLTKFRAFLLEWRANLGA